MTEHADSRALPEEAPNTPQETDTTDTAEPRENAAPEEDNANREAAKYRRKLRDTEAELAAALQTAQQAQRNLIDRIAREDFHLRNPEALWATGVQVADLLDDDGNIDTTKLETAVITTADKFGIPLVRAPRPDPTQGRYMSTPAPTFADGFKPR